MRLRGDFDFEAIAKKTPGFVGADLEALTQEAAAVAIHRAFKMIATAKEGAGGSDVDPSPGTCLLS